MALLPTVLPRKMFARARVERVIALMRVLIAASTLFAVWMDPAEPARHAEFTYTLHAAYLGYALLLVAVMWRRDSRGHAPIITHVGDILIVSVLQYLTLGPSSPFFTYFIYALFSAALRWGWRGTVRTAMFVLLMYVIVGMSISLTLGPTEFELDRFIIRTTYLIVLALVLVYLGQHEAWLREEIERLANWPMPAVDDWTRGVPRILEHAAGIAGARSALLVWTIDEEPITYLASWPAGPAQISRYPPDALDPIVTPPLTDATLLWLNHPSVDEFCLVSNDGVRSQWRGRSVHQTLMAFLEGGGLVSTRIRASGLTGRVFFANLPGVTEEVFPLAELLGREIGASLEHLHSYDRSRELAVAEERIRVARNLHDGVLQSLTGIRLELQRMAAQERHAGSPIPVGDRLLAIERALSLEQRELRCFIEDLKPVLSHEPVGSLRDRLEDLRSRLALEWRTPITIRISPEHLSVPDFCEDAVPLMVHEAVVNALKHGQPTRVSVDVREETNRLRIVVSDDGVGFPFVGRRSQAALVAENAGPVSLRERATSLGGEITIDSSTAGASVELSIPLGVARA